MYGELGRGFGSAVQQGKPVLFRFTPPQVQQGAAVEASEHPSFKEPRGTRKATFRAAEDSNPGGDINCTANSCNRCINLRCNAM
jgi:hypothetical protein